MCWLIKTKKNKYMEITGMLLHFGVSLLLLYIIFNLILKITDGHDLVIDLFINLFKKIKNSYELIRQYIRKKSGKVDADRGTVFDNSEFYDSSSEWED